MDEITASKIGYVCWGDDNKELPLNHMKALQNNSEKVANFFKHPSVLCAA